MDISKFEVILQYVMTPAWKLKTPLIFTGMFMRMYVTPLVNLRNLLPVY